MSWQAVLAQRIYKPWRRCLDKRDCAAFSENVSYNTVRAAVLGCTLGRLDCSCDNWKNKMSNMAWHSFGLRTSPGFCLGAAIRTTRKHDTWKSNPCTVPKHVDIVRYRSTVGNSGTSSFCNFSSTRNGSTRWKGHSLVRRVCRLTWMRAAMRVPAPAVNHRTFGMFLLSMPGLVVRSIGTQAVKTLRSVSKNALKLKRMFWFTATQSCVMFTFTIWSETKATSRMASWLAFTFLKKALAITS